MKDFNENVNNILLGIRNLYKGCEGMECEDCILKDAEICSIEADLCDCFFNITINKD